MNTTTAEISALVDEQDALYCYTATAALLLWHHLITFDQELAYFWRRRPSGVCILFFANRYCTLIVAIYALPWWPLSSVYTKCAATVYAEYTFQFSQYIVWAVFSCLRVYALQRLWRSAILVLVLSLTVVVVNLAHLRFIHVFVDPEFGCDAADYTPPFLYNSLEVLARLSLIIGEVIVAIITWTTLRNHRPYQIVLRESNNGALTISDVMYKNGGIYCVLSTLLNTFRFASSLISTTALGTRMSFIIYFTEPLTGILVTHFLFELYEAAYGRLSGHPASAPGQRSGTSSSVDPSRSLGLIEFVRADVDSLGDSEAEGAPLAGSAAETRWGEECLQALDELQRKLRDSGSLEMGLE